MAKDFQQTDTTAPLGADQACATLGVSNASVRFAQRATDGGSAGTTEVLPRHAQGVTGLAFAMVEIDPGVDVPAGDHITRWDISTANLNVTLQQIHVCWWNGTVFSSLGSTLAIGDDLDASIKSVTITGASASPSYSAGDRLYYVFVGDTAADHGNEQWGWTPSQLMTTPIVAAAPAPIEEILGRRRTQYQLHPAA